MRRARQGAPTHGEQRIIKEFLLFPKTLSTGDGEFEWRWLETAYVFQRYESVAAHGYSYAWVDKFWTTRTMYEEGLYDPE